MAHFYGTLNGRAKTQATRCGTKGTGITAVAASWNGAIEVFIYHDELGRDMFEVSQREWHGKGVSRTLATGVIGQ